MTALITQLITSNDYEKAEKWFESVKYLNKDGEEVVSMHQLRMQMARERGDK